MKKFVLRIILILLPVAVIVPVVNIYVDPAHVYSYEKYERSIVSILQSNKYVTNVDLNHNERYFKKSLIDSCQEDIDILILGSSRVMLISNEMFHDTRILNLGVSGATYEDITALCYYYIKNKGVPHKVIIGIDPQHFNENIGDTRWTELTKEYNEYKKDILKDSNLFPIEHKKIKNIYSPSYFQSSFKYLCKNKFRISTDRNLQALENADGYKVICNDGSIKYGIEYDNRSIEEIEKLSHTLEYGQWENFTDISQYEIYRWRCLLDYLQSLGIEIFIQEAAYHPITYLRFLTETKYMEMINAMDSMDKLAREYNIPILGAYNPQKYNLKSIDFYDGMHMKPTTEQLYLQPLIKQ